MTAFMKIGTLALAWAFCCSSSAVAQEKAEAISLARAVDLAFQHNYVLSRARLDARNASQQLREAWSGVYPQIDGRASYTRTFGALNPFAGSEASDLISQGQAGSFLLSDDNPNAELRAAFQSFLEAQAPEPGEVVDNPFFIENLFSAEIRVAQVLYDGTVFDAVAAARKLKDAQLSLLRDAIRLLIQQVATGYYGVLLAEARLEVLERSEARSESEVSEATILVAEGLQPRTTQLSAEVQLSNTRTDRLRAKNDAATVLNEFKVLLGVPVSSKVRVQGRLASSPSAGPVSSNLEAALAEATRKRPDLKALQLEVERQDRIASTIRAEFAPRLEAVFTFRAIGQVPDDREGEDFFSNLFWGPDITGGIVLTWNIFNGFDSSSRLAQAELGEKRARIDLEERLANVRAEVERERGDLDVAQEQLETQKNNVGRAELNYEETRFRVQEGVTGQADLRDASQQLDESRLNLLQALHDYRVASVDFRIAMGLLPLELETFSRETIEREKDT